MFSENKSLLGRPFSGITPYNADVIANNPDPFGRVVTAINQ
jgi:hypothetical protein